MKMFLLKFYYNTDLRTEITINAIDEVRALVKGLELIAIKDWIVSKEFRIEISLV